MPDANQYKAKVLKFIGAGVDVHAPVDLLPPGKYSRLLNVRGSKLAGTLTCRPGMAALNSSAFPLDAGEGVHSIRRLNDNVGDNNDWVGSNRLVVGSGQRVLLETSTPGAFSLMIPHDSSTSIAWSGRPLSMTPWRPDNSPRTWMYIWDSDRRAKVGRDETSAVLPVPYQMLGVGFVPPNDVATSSGGAGSYYYRYRYRSSTTGAKSNPSPDMLTSVGTGTITAVASTDPGVDLIDYFRFGGALLEYFYVGTSTNTAASLVDAMSDGDAQLNEILATDLDQPFTVAGLPMQGTVTVVAAGGLTTVTWATGDQFINSKNGSLLMKAGTLVELDGKPYALYRATNSATQIVVRGTATGATSYRIANPVLQGKALPFVWGPFQGVFFGCGDILNPGNLYWTNGNDPDSASSLNSQEVTSPSEPLLNGFTHDGRAFVFSSERLFSIYPSVSDNTRWEILETPCQRGMWTNWCYCTTGEKQGGGYVYFLAKDGIYRTQGATGENITDADLYPLFPHEGDNTQGVTANGLLPVDMTQRTYLRLAHSRGYVYFDYKDTEGTRRTLTYEEASNCWYPDSYTPGLRMHYGEEGREAGRLLAGSDTGRIYVSGGNTDAGTGISCQARTRSEDWDEPSVQKLIGDAQIDLDLGDQPVTVQPYFNFESATLAAVVYATGAGRQHAILDLNAGQGYTGFTLALDFSWTNVGDSAILYSWTPSAVPKPQDTVQRCIEWHEFIGGLPDAYVTGVRIWCDTRDLTGAPQAKTIQVWSDQLFTGQTVTLTSNGETEKMFTWPVFKGKLGRLLPTDSNRCRVLRWEWLAETEPPITTHWDTNWVPLGERTAIAYITGVVIVADTQGTPKTLTFQSEFETVTSGHTAIGGSNAMTTAIRGTKSFAFTPFRAEQLRFYSYDSVPGRLYTWEWVTHFIEGRFLANWDSTYQWFPTEQLIKGVRIDADTIGQAKTVDVELDGAIYTTLTVNHNGRLGVHYDLPIDPATNEFPRARVARLYPTDPNAAFLYGSKWLADPEPERLGNWNAKWEDGGVLGAKFLQGLVIDADTGGATKTVVVEYYPEGSASAIATAAILTVNHTGRCGKPYVLVPAVVAHKFRLRPTDAEQNWLYGVKWTFEPHPEKVNYWETQGYSHGLPSYQHRRDLHFAYESTDLVYWIQTIDGQSYAIAFPATGGEYRKVYVPCLPIKGKLFKDTLRCSLPAGIPLVHTASLSAIEDTYTEV